MNLKQLVSRLPFAIYEADLNFEIHDIQIDSRLIQKNELFICIEGYTVDGHDFVEEAVKRGANAIIAEKEIKASVPVIKVNSTSHALAVLSSEFYGEPTKHLDLIGVTGTNGKTTITYILEEIFRTNEKKTGVIGTIQMKINDKVYPINNTTPDALTLQRSYQEMINQEVDTAIMEVSSHALELGRVHGCDFDVAIFTNLSQDHLDFHETMEDYLHSKSLLFSQLGNSYDQQNHKYAILNKDDESYKKLKNSTAQTVVTYSCSNKADVFAKNIQLEMKRTKFTVHTPVGEIDINSKLIGLFNVYNMLAAIAAAICKGVPLRVIKEALENINGVAGRFEAVRLGQPYSVIIDFAHTEDSLENVLKTVLDFVEKNIYVVVGCGGERDKKKRPLMAEVATKYGTHAYFTSDNPRNESPDEILEDMTKNLSNDNYTTIVNRKEAIEQAIHQAEEGDLVLIAGKGHETEQIIGKIAYEFDDRMVAEEAIHKKGFS